MKLAIATTIRNERQLLKQNFNYHRFLGVERFYVFDDGSTDGTRDDFADDRDVSFFPTATSRFAEVAAELGVPVDTLRKEHSYRQFGNMREALSIAAREGIDWIIFIDPDELICVDFEEQTPGQLAAFMSSVAGDVGLVQFPVYEMVQRSRTYRDVFAEETLFKSLFYRRQGRVVVCDLTYRVFDPFCGAEWIQTGYYGHAKGKCAVRVGVSLAHAGLHTFLLKDAGLRLLRPEEIGVQVGLLHYHCYSPDDFLKRFRTNFANTDMDTSPAKRKPVKQLWGRLGRTAHLSDDDIRRYHREWVQFNPEYLVGLTTTRRLGLLRIRGARHVFQHGLGQNVGDDGLLRVEPATPTACVPIGSDQILFGDLEATRWIPS